MQESRQKRLNELLQWMKDNSCEEYSFNKIISLEPDTTDEHGEGWRAVINISGYETQGIQFTENAKYFIKYNSDGRVKSAIYIRGGSDE